MLGRRREVAAAGSGPDQRVLMGHHIGGHLAIRQGACRGERPRPAGRVMTSQGFSAGMLIGALTHNSTYVDIFRQELGRTQQMPEGTAP